MTLAEPPPEGSVPPLEGSRVQEVNCQPLCQQTRLLPPATELGVATAPMEISRNLRNLVISSEPTETSVATETVLTFKTGSLSVRKDMMARLSAMHISDFKRNFRAFEKPCLQINELNLNSADTSKLSLSECSLRVFNTPNAGGNSVWSEVLSMELLSMLYSAKLKNTEMELQYCMQGSITDYSVTMSDSVIGVSVTRAMKYRGVFCYEDALALMTKKMKGVMKSSENIIDEHKWTKQVLHVWVQEPYMVALVEQAYASLTDFHSNTLVQLTVCGDNLGWIFK